MTRFNIDRTHLTGRATEIVIAAIVIAALALLLPGLDTGTSLLASAGNAIADLWNGALSVAVGLGILYGAWCLFWPIIRNFILMLIGWAIIAILAFLTFADAIGL
jgi:hypothetical protein